MARPPKVSNQVLVQVFSSNHDYIKTGKTVGLDPSTVRRRLKNLKINGTKAVVLESAGVLVAHGVDAFAQIIALNNKANKLLNDLLPDDEDELFYDLEGIQADQPDFMEKVKALVKKITRNRSLSVKVMDSILKQLETQRKYLESLYDMKAAAEFQKAVIDSIGEESPETKQRIIEKLQSERAIRASVQF